MVGLRVSLGAPLEQPSGRLGLAGARTPMERRQPGVVGRVDIGTAVKQQLDNVLLPLGQGQPQGRVAKGVFCVKIDIAVAESFDDFREAGFGCDVQRRQLPASPRVRIGALFEQQARDLRLPLGSGQMKRRETFASS